MWLHARERNEAGIDLSLGRFDLGNCRSGSLSSMAGPRPE